MKKIAFVLVTIGLLATVQAVSAQPQTEYLIAKPLSQVVKGQVKSIRMSGTVKVPLITWGGDVATILTEMEGLFEKQGLSVSLFREDNFAKQVEMCLGGETPYLRGTMGMINAAADAFKAKRQELVVVYQLTWSTGGDAMTVRKGKNLKNVKTVALQLYGPHMDYAANLFGNAGRLSKVQFKWLKELTLPTYDTRGKTVDPVSAFQSDRTFDAVMCIIPDALMLTSGGTTGTGAEGSVKGAKILLSTKTAARIIADVYAVRKDYFDANRGRVEKFVNTLMRGEEALRDLLKNKSSQQARYRQVLAKSADLLLGAPQATADVDALLGDCEFVGYSGNIGFFTGKGTTRTLKTLTSEIQKSFIQMGLMTKPVSLSSAGWDYAALATGLKYATEIPKPKKRFSEKKVAAFVEKKLSVEADRWEEEGTLFKVEINFAPNQDVFPEAKYASDYAEAFRLTQTYSGALITIEGHSDPLKIQKAERKGEAPQLINQMKQEAKNLSFRRATAVRNSFIAYCKKQRINLDESQFLAVGRGISSPKFKVIKTGQQWAANRRVVFLIREIEAELTKFEPLN